MELKRRGFLKFLSAVPAVAVAAPVIAKLVPDTSTVSYARAAPTSLGGTMSKVNWQDIQNVPDHFPLAIHTHQPEDIYGWEEVCNALEAVKRSL